MVHPDGVLRYIGPRIGFGLVAARPIPRGTLIWVRDELDQVLSPAALERLPGPAREAAGRYTARTPDGRLILFWDLARYINHACAPSSLIAGPGVTIAVRDIPAGGEITEDYASLHLLPEESFDCACGLTACRGRVGPEDAPRLAPAWESLVSAALAAAGGVPQPLGPIPSRALL